MQKRVQQILDRAVADGTEGAVQVAAFHHGRLIVDAWAAAPGRRINGATLFPIFSTGKGIAATAIHRLAERGVLSWDDPIARHWPEFAAHGKGAITLRQALDHTAGLPMLPEHGTMGTPADWDAMCRYLADSPPAYPPGSRRLYHAVTFSWLLGETAHRADGRMFDRFIAEEVCRPLGLQHLFFGVPEGLLPGLVDAERVPPASPPTPPTAPPDPIAARSVPGWMTPLEDWINRADIRRACIPASNGFATAHDLARHYAALIGDGVDGLRLLRPETVAAATRWEPIPGVDKPGDGPRGLGYGLQGPADAPGAAFGHGGYGGSSAFADQRCNLAVGFVRSRMGGACVLEEVLRAIRCGIGA
jgi:CubicO group peptidase (beta-lactamase class C family)